MGDGGLTVEHVYRAHAGSVLGTLVGWLRDVDLAEDSLHEAVVAACRRWPVDGEPSNPAAWLVRVAHNAAIDRLRREGGRAEREERAERWSGRSEAPAGTDPADAIEELDEVTIVDDQLRLLFLCCHPALAADTQVALTLRSIAGLTTTEIAHAFLVPEPTMAQRLVRAKKKIRAAGIPFVLPGPEDLADRRDQVLHTVYLVFNEGYSATAGDEVIRRELCTEAIRLARVIVTLMPDEPEALGLLALMLLQDSRRDTRVDGAGDLVLLADQDRTRWDTGQVAEGVALVERALGIRRVGPYQLEAAIAALHATALSATATDWPQIAALYGVLMRVAPSPVIALNRAVAVSTGPVGSGGGPAAALMLVEALDDVLTGWHRYHSTRAHLLRQLDRPSDALSEYERALDAVGTGPEHRFLQRQIEELSGLR